MEKHIVQLINPVLPGTIGRGGTEKGGEATGLLLSNLIGGMLILAFVLAMIYLLTGAFHWITSGGDKASLESARNKITHAIVGLIIVGAAWSVMVLVAQFFGLEFTNLPIPAIPTVGQ